MEIGLVLGGGGARGLAHIGALRALEERGLRPAAIAGCSIGAIVGALYASGHSASDIERLARSVRLRDLIDIGRHGAILGNDRIGKYLGQHLPETFEELGIPFKLTATDCQNGRMLVLGTGPLVPAVLGSSALPGVLSPIFLENRVLIDGGVLNNLPVDVIRVMTTRPVVAVDIAVPPDRKLDFEDNRSLKERILSAFDSKQRWLTIELFMKSFDIPLERNTQSLLTIHPPDLLVRPALDPDFKREDFQRIDEAIAEGRRATLAALDDPGLPAD